MSEAATGSQRDAASFRDPAGYVFRHAGRVFRALDARSAADLLDLLEMGSLQRLVADRLVVPTSFVASSPLLDRLAIEHAGAARFLEHDAIDPITYPYCWTVSMLADAAALTLDVQLRLLETGHSLKDATAYNVQFARARPLFIDLASIERPPRLDIWVALGQFQQMFTYPLLLARYRGWDLRSYFLPSLGGRTAAQVGESFRGLSRLRPGLLLDLTLPLWLDRRSGEDGPGREVFDRPNPNSAPQAMNLRRLRKKVLALAAGYRPQGVWARYTQECSYVDAATAAKKRIVAAMLDRVKPRRVLDLGCNTGVYSLLAAEAGSEVIAADADHDAVEMLYRRVRGQDKPITPIVVDLCNPSPAIGFRNLERPRLVERIGADAVLALALLHHLHVSGNLPLEAIASLFDDLTRDALVLEFVPTDDVMFRRLTRLRRETFEGMTLERCLAAFAPRFDLVAREPVPEGGRVLLLFRKRRAVAA
ncbi:MAG TPA: class I SAM-dependent methyltransferase [Candidatus Polarisedimenticolia bacterium]|nr:class I SAM-dependent methyltransferase [Candidatus Polarisedimenticolia bacterium]